MGQGQLCPSHNTKEARMTATEMLTAALNGALRRKVVNGARLRGDLIEKGVIKPAPQWKLQERRVHGPGGHFVKKVLVEVNHD